GDFGVKRHTDQVALALIMSTLAQEPGDSYRGDNLILVDVGANKGQTQKFALKLLTALLTKRDTMTAMVLSYEPAPATFKLLEKEVGAFKKQLPEDSRLTLASYEKGLGERAGMELLHVAAAGDQAASFSLRKARATGKLAPREEVQVEVVTVDDELNRHLQIEWPPMGRGAPITDIVVVKIDTEGWEDRVIRGMAAGLKANAYAAIVWEWCPQKMAKGSLRLQVTTMAAHGMLTYVVGTAVFLRLYANEPALWQEAGGMETTTKTLNLLALPLDSPVNARIEHNLLLCAPYEEEPLHLPQFQHASRARGHDECECWRGGGLRGRNAESRRRPEQTTPTTRVGRRLNVPDA
ncbi:hypothetical protein CYMTET_39758, partial [Cymbomonas tetramitiformis]